MLIESLKKKNHYYSWVSNIKNDYNSWMRKTFSFHLYLNQNIAKNTDLRLSVALLSLTQHTYKIIYQLVW